MSHGSGYSRAGRTTGAILNEAAVRNMRMRDSQSRAAGFRGVSVRELADDYKVGLETIRRILRWDTWKWVAEEGPGAEAADWQTRPVDEAAVAASLAKVIASLPPEMRPKVPALVLPKEELPAPVAAAGAGGGPLDPMEFLRRQHEKDSAEAAAAQAAFNSRREAEVAAASMVAGQGDKLLDELKEGS